MTLLNRYKKDKDFIKKEDMVVDRHVERLIDKPAVIEETKTELFRPIGEVTGARRAAA